LLWHTETCFVSLDAENRQFGVQFFWWLRKSRQRIKLLSDEEKSCLLSEIYDTNMVLRIINVCVYFDVSGGARRIGNNLINQRSGKLLLIENRSGAQF
jgi:hypothetical protein